MKNNSNAKLLKSFISYCDKHPELRFWQALRSWSQADAIIYRKDTLEQDTFYWFKKNETKTLTGNT